MAAITNIPSPREIDDLTREIHVLESHAVERTHSAIQLKMEIGKRLARAKEIMPHGQFLSWARREFRWEPRHVQRHMELARNASRVSHLLPDSSLRAALAAIAGPKAPDQDGGSAEKPEKLRFTISLEDCTSIDLEFRNGTPEAEFMLRAANDSSVRVELPRADLKDLAA